MLRTACDGWDGCTTAVGSGAHRGYRPDPQKPLDYALSDLLLTRGEGPIDEIGFASQVAWGVPDDGLQEYVIEKLRQLALTEYGDVKASACKQLWVYTKDSTGVRLNQIADRALQEADCRCSSTRHNVECR